MMIVTVVAITILQTETKSDASQSSMRTGSLLPRLDIMSTRLLKKKESGRFGEQVARYVHIGVTDEVNNAFHDTELDHTIQHLVTWTTGAYIFYMYNEICFGNKQLYADFRYCGVL